MEIIEARQGAVTVLRPKGPLCAEDAESFREKVASVIDQSLGRFIIDATDVPYVDSRGLEVLKETTEELMRSGQALRLCGATETVREVLDVTDLAKLFEHYHDVNSAVRSFL
jgi:anti-anti-sigma factor